MGSTRTCWSTSSFEQSCETDAGQTEHRLYCVQSETQILASCVDVGTFNAQSPDLEQGETVQVRKDLEALACQVSGHLTPEEMSRMANNSTDAQWDTVVRELFWDTSCVDPVRHFDRSHRAPSLARNASARLLRRDNSCRLRRSYAINVRNMVSGTRCAFSLMMMLCVVRVVRTSGRGCDSWTTFQMREERTVEMYVVAGR